MVTAGRQSGAAEVAGLILAGGQSRRMGGGHKSLLALGSDNLLGHAITRLAPQVGALALSVNQDLERFAGFGRPLLQDRQADFAGPLAGVEAGLSWLATSGAGEDRLNDGPRYLALASCDAPFFPLDLVERLWDAVQSDPAASVAMAVSQGRRHPVFSLWSVDLLDELRMALDAGVRKVEAFTEPQGVALVEWPVEKFDIRGQVRALDPFFNINRPDDLAEAQDLQQALDQDAPNRDAPDQTGAP